MTPLHIRVLNVKRGQKSVHGSAMGHSLTVVLLKRFNYYLFTILPVSTETIAGGHYIQIL